MIYDKFYERERIPKKKSKEKSKKRPSISSHESQTKDYDIGNLLSDVGNREIASFLKSGLVQAKLHGNQPGGRYEQEANRIAENIVHTNSEQILTYNRIQKKSGQRNVYAQGNTELKTKHLKGKGQSLNKSVKEYFEPRFGVDLGNIRVHTDDNANLLAKSINARAFTYGNEIVFGNGEYNPETMDGKKLIAHELTHTIQQKSTVKDKESSINIDKKNNRKQENLLAKLGKGQPLSSSLQSRMGSLFGTRFSDVRIHTDSNAGQIAEKLNAKAFTFGNHIGFNSNEYKPGTPAGDILIAHELAHTIQQKGTGKDISQKSISGNISHNSALEKDADMSTLGVILKMLGKVKSGFKQIMPRLKTGLTISRCSPSPNRLINMDFQTISTTTFYVRPLSERNKLKNALQAFNIIVTDNNETYKVRDPGNGNRTTDCYKIIAKVTELTPSYISARNGFENVFSDKGEIIITEYNNTNLINNLHNIKNHYNTDYPAMFSLLQGQNMGRAENKTCIGMMNQSIVNLYGSHNIQLGDLGDKASDTIENLNTMGKVHTLRDFEATCDNDDKIIKNNRDNADEIINFEYSPGQWMNDTVTSLSRNNDQNGVYVFSCSIAKAFHSANIIILKYDNEIYSYWKDQNQFQARSFDNIDYFIKRLIMYEYYYLVHEKGYTSERALSRVHGDMKKSSFALLKP